MAWEAFTSTAVPGVKQEVAIGDIIAMLKAKLGR